MKTNTVIKKISWARQTLLVNEHFQLRLIAFCALTALVACGFFYGASTYFFVKYHSFAVSAGFQATNPFFKVLRNMQDMMTVIFAFTSAATLLFSILAGLAFSNRIAGPMYRMRTHFERVARGETLSGIEFREDDYFGDVAHAYNKQMDYVRSQLHSDVNKKIS